MTLVADDVRALLRKACEKSGTQQAWARKHGLSPTYVSDVLVGRREPGPAICKILRVERVPPETIYYMVAAE